jgi:hypothetical protein
MSVQPGMNRGKLLLSNTSKWYIHVISFQSQILKKFPTLRDGKQETYEVLKQHIHIQLLSDGTWIHVSRLMFATKSDQRNLSNTDPLLT